MSTFSLSRRTLMKGAAAGLLAPFYRSVLAQATAPKRLVIVLECNGLYPQALLSAGTRTALGSAAIGGRHHNFIDTYPSSPLVRMGDDVSTALCLGPLSTGGASLVNRSAVVLGLSSTITGGGHSSGTGALSCAVHNSAATFDAVMAAKLKGNTPFEALRLGTSSSLTSIVYETCAYGPRKPAGILVNPALAWDTTFGTLASTTGSGAERGALFDFARDDVRAALQTFKGPSAERVKLERYLTSLEALRTREGQLRGMAGTVRPLLPPAPAVNPLLTSAGTPPDSLKWLEAQFEIATASLLGGLTNVVVLASGSSGFDVRYPLLGGIGRHDLQHGIDASANWTAIAQVTTKHVELIAKLARTLLATPEVGSGGGTMLDNTAILFMSDNGEQHHSEAREWPALLVGGNGLGLKTDGRTVVFPGESRTNNRQFSNLFNTLGQALGDASMNAFGSEGPTRIAMGPLAELR